MNKKQNFTVYRGWNRWSDEGFTFLVSDVSISWGYLLVQMPLWQPLYLHWLNICCCRCSFGSWCICNPLIFAVADALLAADVSAIPWYSLLQMLFWGPAYLQLALLWTCRCFSAYLSCTIASASCLFWDLRILPSQILHLHPTFSITWRCSPSKFCIFNPLESTIADIVARYPLSSIYFTTWANTLLTKNWYKKFERIWSERWRHLERKFCINEFERTCLKLRSSKFEFKFICF